MTGQWVTGWADSVSEQAEQAWRLSDQVAVLSVDAEELDGAVVVTVAGSGALTDLRLTERALDLPATRLAETILSAMRRAQGGIAGRVAELAAGTVGAESPTGRAVLDAYRRKFPVPGDDDGGY